MGIVDERKSAWAEHAQAFEIGYWTLRGNRIGSKREYAGQIWTRFGFDQDQFAGKTIYDVGCGPTGLTHWFSGAKRVGIDPLADHYRKLPGVDVGIYEVFTAAPAEEPVKELTGCADFVFSVNSLDHCYDLDMAVSGLLAYAKPGARGFISVDVDKPVEFDPSHPICVTSARMTKAIIAAGWRIERAEHGCCYPAEPRWLDAWGGGMAYHYWVKKPE